MNDKTLHPNRIKVPLDAVLRLGKEAAAKFAAQCLMDLANDADTNARFVFAAHEDNDTLDAPALQDVLDELAAVEAQRQTVAAIFAWLTTVTGDDEKAAHLINQALQELN